MKHFYDDEFVGYGVLTYDEPVDFGNKECDQLKQKGYKQVCLPHITTRQEGGKSRSQCRTSLGINLSACCHTLAKELIVNSKDLPTLLFVKDTLNGRLTLRPFRLVTGTEYPTNSKDSNNKKIFVNLVEEPPLLIN